MPLLQGTQRTDLQKVLFTSWLQRSQSKIWWFSGLWVSGEHTEGSEAMRVRANWPIRKQEAERNGETRVPYTPFRAHVLNELRTFINSYPLKIPLVFNSTV